MKNWLTGLCLLYACIVVAQPRGEWGLTAGMSTYLGDLVELDNTPYWNTLGPVAGARGGINLNYTMQARLNLLYANLRGSDNNIDNPIFDGRGFAFQSDLYELSLHWTWEPWARKRYPQEGGYRKIVSPYLFVGGGLVFFQPHTDYNLDGMEEASSAIRQDQRMSATASPQLVLPFGGGFRLDLSNETSVDLELGLRKSYTDLLDGVSVSGNPKAQDWYLIGGITLSKRISWPDYDRDGLMDEEDRCPEAAGGQATLGCPDADGDGIPDIEDMCPYQPGKRSVNGCPDSDYDGVADLIDDCPDLPGDLTGKGCPDMDGDRIPDDEDMCPDCAGDISMSGCPDADGDGIADNRDRCPNLPGSGEWGGCPFADTDEDGIRDSEDECPDVKGTRLLAGCPDRDGDGVTDAQDACPDVYGELESEGCPVVPQEVEETLVIVTKAVQFETASAKLKASSLEKLSELVSILGDYPYFDLQIEGHTDSSGGRSANQRLSEARAKACYDYLLTQGISADRMEFVGHGEDRPIAPNRSSSGRRINRRVEFTLNNPSINEK